MKFNEKINKILKVNYTLIQIIFSYMQYYYALENYPNYVVFNYFNCKNFN